MSALKLHIGCGSVYLLDGDWLNIDLPLPYVYRAVERPELVVLYGTDEANYYARHQHQTIETWREGPKRLNTVCDVYGSFTSIPARPESADEILSRQVFEHLNIEQGKRALAECYRVLKHGGLLRLDVPDPEETLRLYRETGDKFYLRHFFGPRADEFGLHTPYTREMLARMGREAGFTHEWGNEEENIHPYPAFCLRFRRGV